jgi:hypothetical protein
LYGLPSARISRSRHADRLSFLIQQLVLEELEKNREGLVSLGIRLAGYPQGIIPDR